MANIYICEGCDCQCKVIASGQPTQPANTTCLWPDRREGHDHHLVKPEWYIMRRATIREVKEPPMGG